MKYVFVDIHAKTIPKHALLAPFQPQANAPHGKFGNERAVEKRRAPYGGLASEHQNKFTVRLGYPFCFAKSQHHVQTVLNYGKEAIAPILAV